MGEKIFFYFVGMLLFVVLLGLSAVALAHKDCACAHDSCGCCVPVHWKEIHLNDTACLNITYFPQSLSVSLTLTLGPHTIINKTVSATAPDICVGIPFIKKFAS